jgi:hypothetical protein
MATQYVLALDPDSPSGVTVVEYRGNSVSLVPIAISVGGGIDELTGDVLAGPGSGSIAATVVGLQGVPLPAPPVTGTTVLTDVSGTLAWDAASAGGITQLTGDVAAGPGAGSVASVVNRVTGNVAGALQVGEDANTLQLSGSAITLGDEPTPVHVPSLAGSGTTLVGATNAGLLEPIDLSGDIAGGPTDTTLENIQGLPLPTPPSTGTTVLTDTAGVLSWSTGAGEIVLMGGDVEGDSDECTVVAIQNVPVPAPPGTGTTVLTDTAGVLAWDAPAGGQFLTIPGTLVAPPTVASGGWAVVNNAGGGVLLFTDQPWGILITNEGTENTAGLVRPGTSQAEVGLDYFNDGQVVTVGGTNQMLAGAYMYESATGKFLEWMLISFYHSSAAYESLYLIGTDVAAVQYFGTFRQGWGTKFLRLLVSGANILVQLSLDRINWVTLTTVALTTAFTTAPDHVGVASWPANFGKTYVHLYDGVFA